MNKKIFIVISYISIALPGVILLLRYFSGDLGANPIQEATHITGRNAINLLVATLAVSPIIDLLQIRWVSPIRRWLGVSAFLYATVHFLIFVWWDYGLNLELILDVLLDKWFAIFGIITFVIFTVLAITSTNGWQKKMGKSWKKLHKYIYLAGVSASTHYLLAVKLDLRRPIAFASIIGFLLILRLKPLKKLTKALPFNQAIPESIRKLKLT